MQILNNLAALNTLNLMNGNTKKGKKAMNQVATGEKFSGAAFYASEYQISEKMRTKIRGLDQCNANSAKGSSAITIASNAVQEQIELLKQARARAMQATDDTYNDVDRLALQDEVTQLLKEVDDIAVSTNYNGISLLDKRRIAEKEVYFDPDVASHDNPPGKVLVSERYNYSGREGTGYQVPQGTYNHITTAYAPAWSAGNPFSGPPRQGDYVFYNGVAYPVYLDSNQNNDPCFTDGTQTINLQTSYSNYNQAVHAQITTPITVGMQITTSHTADTPTYTVVAEPGSQRLSYVTPSSESTYVLNFSSFFNAGNQVPQGLDGIGFSSACTGCDQYVTVRFDASTSSTVAYTSKSGAECYVVGVANVTDEPSLLQTLYEGIASKNGYLTGNATSGSVNLSYHSLNINKGYDVNGNVYYTLTKNGPSMVMINGVMGALITDNFYLPEWDLPIQTDTKSNQQVIVKMPETRLSTLFPSDDKLRIEPKEEDYPEEWPGNYETLYKKYKEEENGTLPFQNWAKKHWRETVWKYPAEWVDLDLSRCVTTKENAHEFMDNVDQAIKYLLHANTNLGAQSTRLSFTQDNLTVGAENLTASESTIRDADMAQSMTDKVKYDLLQQASQAMLAQANQAPQNVLGLLP